MRLELLRTQALLLVHLIINLGGVSFAKMFCLPYSVIVVITLRGRLMAMMKVQVATNIYQLDVDSVPAAQVS